MELNDNFITNTKRNGSCFVVIQIDGDKTVAQEVIAQVKLWDQAVVDKNINALIDQCSPEVSMFDVTSQLEGVDVYKSEWEKFRPFFIEGMRISRKEMKLHASDKLAVLHCLSKVENNALKNQLQMPWCRTTLCLKKIDDAWKVVHQHISIPVDMKTGKAIKIEEKSHGLVV